MHKDSVWQRRWNSLLVLVLAVGWIGCASEPVEEERYQVRGVFLGHRFEGAAMRVRHEEIPGFMEAMAMDFKLADPSETEGLNAGDKIAFVYIVSEEDSYAAEIKVLPPDTPLDLGED